MMMMMKNLKKIILLLDDGGHASKSIHLLTAVKMNHRLNHDAIVLLLNLSWMYLMDKYGDDDRQIRWHFHQVSQWMIAMIRIVNLHGDEYASVIRLNHPHVFAVDVFQRKKMRSWLLLKKTQDSASAVVDYRIKISQCLMRSSRRAGVCAIAKIRLHQ
jgi:hypothetical protein